MIKFHLDKILKKNNLTINSFTHLLNEYLEPQDRSISRKTVTSIANNTAKNIQISAIEDILDYFKLNLEDLITVENSQDKLTVVYSYENSTIKNYITINDERLEIPIIYFDLFVNGKSKSPTFHIQIPLDNESKPKSEISVIQILPMLTNLSDDLTDKQFENKIQSDEQYIYTEFHKNIEEIFSYLTPTDIEFIFKKHLEILLSEITKQFYGKISCSKIIYFSISDILVAPILVDFNDLENKCHLDFSFWINSTELIGNNSSLLSEEKKIFVEVKDQNNSY